MDANQTAGTGPHGVAEADLQVAQLQAVIQNLQLQVSQLQEGLTASMASNGAREQERLARAQKEGLSMPRGFDIPEFWGKPENNIEAWVCTVQEKFRLAAIWEDAQVLLATGALRGDASTWYESNQTTILSYTWGDFVTAIKAEYNTRYSGELIKQKLATLRFKGSYNSYITYFRSLVGQLKATDLSYGSKMDYFLAPLDPQAQILIRYKDPINMEELYAATVQYARSVPTGQKKGNRLISNNQRFATVTPVPMSQGEPMQLDATSAPHGGNGEKRTCYNCGQVGHLARNCRQPRKNRPQQSNVNALSIETMRLTEIKTESNGGLEVPQISHLSPTVTEKINGVHTDNILLDPGAHANFVNSDLVKELGLTPHGQKRTFKMAQKGATGTTLGTVSLRLSFGSNKEAVIEAHVTNLDRPLILGYPFLCQWGMNICKTTGQLSIGDNQNGCTGTVASTEAMTVAHEQWIEDIKRDYGDIMGTPPYPPERKWDHGIPTGDALPIRQADRPRSPKEHEAIKAFVDDGLARGIIEPAEGSSWASPLLLVPKKDGDYRVCADYRRLNAVTVKDAYPLVWIDDCYQFLYGAVYFTTLDFSSGYWQIRLKPSDIDKTSFLCRYGLFRFKVMPFGLCNAPATFQYMMNDIMAPYLDRFAMVYLDDIIIYSKTMDDHRKHVRCVLDTLREHKLYLSPGKCTWGARELEFLGHVVNGEGIRPSPKKLEVLKNWPTPKTARDVRSVVGLLTYYKRFSRDFAGIAGPLYDVMSKDRSFLFQEREETALRTLIRLLCKASTQRYPRLGFRFFIDTDASKTAVGAVLQQEDNITEDMQKPLDLTVNPVRESNLRPIAFASHKLSETETRYSAQEVELLGICYALEHWRGIIEGSPVIVRTDHEPLKYLRTQKELGRRVRRFIDIVEHYDAKIVYCTGKSNLAADALSRTDHGTSDPGPLLKEIELCPLDIDTDTNGDTSPLEKDCTLHRTAHGDSDHPDHAQYEEKDSTLWRKDTVDGKELIRRAPTSPDEALRWADDLHVTAGHYGRVTTAANIREQMAVYGRTALNLADAVITVCEVCQRTQKPSNLLQALTPIHGGQAFDCWGIDFVGPLGNDGGAKHPDGNYIITAIDYATSWTVAKVIDGPTTAHAKRFIADLLFQYGTPTAMLSDNGAAFSNEEYWVFCTRLGIKPVFTSVYHPQTNGKVERFHQQLKGSLRKYALQTGQPWQTFLPQAILDHRQHIIEDLGVSPAYMVYGRALRKPKQPVYQETVPTTVEESRQYLDARVNLVHDLDRFRDNLVERSYLLRMQEAGRRCKDTCAPDLHKIFTGTVTVPPIYLS